jgi:hypothetical protein
MAPPRVTVHQGRGANEQVQCRFAAVWPMGWKAVDSQQNFNTATIFGAATCRLQRETVDGIREQVK